jgi:adenosylmethionine-8-amino-7-oxononanoate aminotransferase
MDKMYADMETIAAGYRAKGMGEVWDAQMEQLDQGEFVQSKDHFKKELATELAKGF